MTEIIPVVLILLVSLYQEFNKKVRRHSLRLPFVVLQILLFFYLLGPSIWNLIRTSAGDGLLGFIPSTPESAEKFRNILFPMIIATFLADRLAVHYLKISKLFIQDFTGARKTMTRESKILAIFLVVFPMFIWLAGEGGSILSRAEYLYSNGIPILLRLSGITHQVSVFTLAFLSFAIDRNHRALKGFCLVSFVWVILLLSKGSRTTILILSIALIYVWKMSHMRYQKVVTLLVGLVSLPVCVSAVFLAREEPHGILNLPTMLSRGWSETYGNESSQALNAMSRFISSIFNIVIIVPLSVDTISSDAIWANANPLISSISENSFDFSTNGVQRLFPYVWVPTSSAGALFGIVGFFGIFIITFVANLIQSIAFIYYRRTSTFPIYALISACYLAQNWSFLQYSTRPWFRMWWALLFSFGALLIWVFSRRLIERNHSLGA